MRKGYFILAAIFLMQFAGSGQTTINKIAHNYFRSDPFESDFSSFLKHLLNDPTLTNKIIEKKTDSSLFYFEGVYTSHNPFFFKPTRVEVVLFELPVALDSVTTDTVYTYQLMAYNKNSAGGVAEVKKEFEKLFRKYKPGFARFNYSENPVGAKVPGATYNFFDKMHGLAPFAITWMGPTAADEMCLIITLRMQSENNIAILPVPFYTF